MPDREALERQKRHAAALLGIATHEAVRAGALERAAHEIHEVVARTLDVERVSTWLLSDDRHELRCVDLFELSAGRHASGETLRADDYPRYFQVLRSARAVDAHDARTDPRTSEFTHDYLEPRGITAVLDAPIRVSGEVVGVVWIEHVRTARTWSADELVFAADVADQTAQALVQEERAHAEEALRASERRLFTLSKELERRVEERTEELARANVELRRLASELLLAEERERRALAVDLHDGPNQVLALAQMKLSAVRSRADGPLRDAVREIEALVERANRSVRSLSFQLSPPVLHDLGLVAALEWLCEDLQSAYKVPMTCAAKGVEPGALDERQRVTLFRSVRELLVNVGKHARAREVRVLLEVAAGRLVIRVEDDGIGFDVRATRPGAFGLSSVRERLGGLGGKMDVRGRRGGGTSVVLEVPLGEPNEDGMR